VARRLIGFGWNPCPLVRDCWPGREGGRLGRDPKQLSPLDLLDDQVHRLGRTVERFGSRCRVGQILVSTRQPADLERRVMPAAAVTAGLLLDAAARIVSDPGDVESVKHLVRCDRPVRRI